MKTTLRNILIFAVLLLFLAGIWYFREIVAYILVLGVLSIMGRPLVDLICRIKIRKWYFPRSLSAFFTLLIIWGIIILFFYIFIPLVTSQIKQLSTIDSSRIVQIIEGPIKKVENLFRTFNKDITKETSLQAYIMAKVAGVLNINLLQNFIGSLAGILGNIWWQSFQ